MVLTLFSFLLTCLLVLICVSFYTLFERKVLGLAHLRLGPGVVSIFGLFQPFADGLKLFCKRIRIVQIWSFILYFVRPCALLIISFGYLVFWEGKNLSPSFSYSVLGFLTLLIIRSYPSIFVGWSRTSEWALLGAVRNVAIIVSFEVGLSFLIIRLCILYSSCCFWVVVYINSVLVLMTIPWCLLWLIRVVSELNRTPFDIGEAERELVSGLNIEYSGGGFSLLFISEYSNMIFIRLLRSCLILRRGLHTGLCLRWGSFILFTLIWLRVRLPRVRYDKLIMLFWLIIVPLVLLLTLFHAWGVI